MTAKPGIRGLKRSFSECGIPTAKRTLHRSLSQTGTGNGAPNGNHAHHEHKNAFSSPSQSFFALRKQRQNLPIYSARQALIVEVREQQNVIIVGETGSGKTTQIPQFLYEAKMAKFGAIACTQPRRVAAVSVAHRVAREMGVKLGEQVGYSVRFDDVTSPKTKVKYMTDGMLLREAVSDPNLRKYAVVILDEAHERTVHTDVLFGVVKSAQKRRKNQGEKPLKIIIMSATLQADDFAHYFDGAKVLYVQGRQYPVKIMYTVEQQVDYIHAALIAVMQLHQEESHKGDILVFLTGQDEIESLAKLVTACSQSCPTDCPRAIVCPMFAALPHKQQMKVFQPAPEGTRKIILATNIAETSVTIPGVKYVLDTGYVKARGFNPETGLDMLSVQPVSKAQARQRTGRAGRECSGHCYRLYTEEQFDQLQEITVPEIQRCNLSSVVLQLMALGVSNLQHFDFMDCPSDETMENAINQLEILGALVKRKGVAKLSPIGHRMAVFPLEPRLSKVILKAEEFRCTEEILTVVALLSVDSLTYTPQDKRDLANTIRKKFLSTEGDQITSLNMYKAYKSVGGNKNWCHEHFINTRVMKQVQDVRKQLRDLCIRLEIPLTSCGNETSVIRNCLTTGLFMNSAELQLDGTYRTLAHGQTVAIHPASALFMSKPSYVLYNELVYTSKCYMRDVCVVDPDWLVATAPRFFKRHKLRPQMKAVPT